MTLRVGLAGCGWIAPYQIQAWRLVTDTEVVGVCDIDLSRAHTLASAFRIGWAGQDAVRMMDECGLNVLDIATPPDSHNRLALEAMNRGLHVLCQKPAALTLNDAEEMIDHAVQRRVVLYINEMLRFCPWFRRTFELLRSNSIGRPVFARLFSRSAGFLEAGPTRKVPYGFRTVLRSSQRVILLEETIHYLDIMRYLFGEPESIYAVTQRVSPLLRGEDMVTIVLRYEGMTGVIEDSWSSHGPERSGMDIEGTLGGMFLSHSKILELYSAQKEAIAQRWDFSGLSWDEQRPRVFAALLEEYLKVIRSNEDLIAQARDNLNTLRLALLAYESAETRLEVKA